MRILCPPKHTANLGSNGQQAFRPDSSMQAPIYSFVESRRVGFKQLDPPSSRVVIVEGIYALSSRMG